MNSGALIAPLFFMNVFSFLYLISIFIIFNIYAGFGDINFQNQILISSSLIILFGIPHGSLDNILFLSKNKISVFSFYTIYLFIAFIYLIAWIWWPYYSFIFFLIISAYHFGESHFSDYKLKFKAKNFVFIIWGLFLMTSLLFLNSSELILTSEFFFDTKQFSSIYSDKIISNLFYVSLILTVLMLLFLVYKKYITTEDMFSEIFQYFLIFITFYLFPIIIGFTLYFVFIHSFRSLYHEYKYLKKIKKIKSIFNFIKLLIPHSIAAYFFTFIICYASLNNVLNISIPMVILIIVSVITLPHALVMSNFYNK